jgi:1,4-dihydroxy-2-naphthoyl-CoA synthase
MELILTGRLYDAEEALRIGSVINVVEPDNLMEEAIAIAEGIDSNGPLAVRSARQTILRGVGRRLNDDIAFEIDTFSYLCKSEGWTRGQRAFLHGEKPDFPRPLRMHMSHASSRRYPGLVSSTLTGRSPVEVHHPVVSAARGALCRQYRH